MIIVREAVMRKLMILLMVMLIAGNAFAIQRRSTLVERGPEVGWYVSPVVKFGEVGNDTRVFGGVRGGLTVDRSFYVGAAIYGSPDDEDWPHRYDWLDIGYGGVEFGTVGVTSNLTTMSLGVLIGGGQVEEYHYDYYRDEGFFLIEPSVNLMFNVTRKVQLGFGASYRFVDNLNHPALSNDDLSGPSFNMSLSFGRF